MPQTETAVATLPKNFDALTKPKQKEIVFNELLKMSVELANIDQTEEYLKEQIKAKKSQMNGSKEGKELIRLTKQKKDDKKRKELLLSERNGALILAKRLGIDVTHELQNVKQLNAGNN